MAMTPLSWIFQTRILREMSMLKVKGAASTESKFRCFKLKLLVKSMTGKVDVAVIGAGGDVELNAVMENELIEGFAEFVSPHLQEAHS